jgi:hypothetical protein
VKLTLYPDVLRKSTMIREFRRSGDAGAQRAIDEIEMVHAKFPSCAVHGKLGDPIIMVAGEGDAAQIAIVCPWCSDPAIQAAYEAEANLS